MRLRTQCYLPEEVHEAVDAMLGLPDLRKGLNTILLGYLVTIGAILAAVGIVFYLIVQTKGVAPTSKEMENASTVVFALILLLPLAGLMSLAMIIRGKWLCLMNAPEHFHAKWMMFLSILCVVAGPLLNTGAFFVGDDKPADPTRPSHSMSIARIQHEIEEYKHGIPELGARSYVKLAGQGIGMLSTVFFILFLRAVALSTGFWVLARLSELYLLLIALLVVGVAILLRNPNFMLARPQLLLALLGGFLLSGPWYLGLIVATSIGITYHMARGQRERREPAPAAPEISPLASLPPIE
jgi:hypothetical protein